MNKKICGNCFLIIEDMRKEIRCSVCNSTLHKDCAIKDGGTFFCDNCYTVKQQETPQIEVPDVIRRSYIESYRSCPNKGYYEIIKGILPPPNIYAQLGIDLHELFKKASLDNNYNKQNMLENFHEIWYDYPTSLFEHPISLFNLKQTLDEFKDSMYQKAINSIDNLYIFLPSMPNPISAEETIHFSIGDDLPKIETTSDRINPYKDGLELVDWKTGKVMTGTNFSSDLQAPLYIYGVQQKYQKQVYRFVFYYLNESKVRIFEWVGEDKYVCKVGKREYFINLSTAIGEVQRVFSKIKQGNFNIPRNIKNMYFTCKMCHLKQMKICRGAELEVWYQTQR